MVHMARINPVVEMDHFDAPEIRARLSSGQAGCVIVRETIDPSILAGLSPAHQRFLSRHWVAAAPSGRLGLYEFNHRAPVEDRSEPDATLKDAFAALVENDITRMAEISTSGTKVRGRFCLDYYLSAGAHIDRVTGRNIAHRHLIGDQAGMVIFCPEGPVDIRPANNAGDQFDRTQIDRMVRQGNAKLRQLKPGEIAYFNDTCLHWSFIPRHQDLSEVPKFRVIYA